MRYIRIDDNNVAQETILEFDPTFPDIPISERYPKDFVELLIPVEDCIEVGQHWIYNRETNTFNAPPIPEPQPEPEPGEPIVPIPSLEERITSLEEESVATMLAITELYEMQIGG